MIIEKIKLLEEKPAPPTKAIIKFEPMEKYAFMRVPDKVILSRKLKRILGYDISHGITNHELITWKLPIYHDIVSPGYDAPQLETIIEATEEVRKTIFRNIHNQTIL